MSRELEQGRRWTQAWDVFLVMSAELQQARASLKAAKTSWCSRNYLWAAYCLARATRCGGEARRLRREMLKARDER